MKTSLSFSILIVERLNSCKDDAGESSCLRESQESVRTFRTNSSHVAVLVLVALATWIDLSKNDWSMCNFLRGCFILALLSLR